MSLSAEVLDALLAAGCSAEQIVAAVKADLEGEEARLTIKRAKDAERQRKSRAIRAVSRPVTVTPSDATDGDTAPYTTTTPVTPKGVTAPKGSERNRGSKISEDWTAPPIDELGPDFRKLASQWTEDNYRTEASAFRSYWLAETGVKASKSNWKRAWENRVAQIHGKVMRDQRFAAPSNDIGNGYLENLRQRSRGP